MRLDGRMEVVHAGEAKPERTGLLTSVALCPDLLPLAHWLHLHWLSLTSQEPCCLRTFAQFFLPETLFFFFFGLYFCFVKTGFFIPFDLISHLVSSGLL